MPAITPAFIPKDSTKVYKVWVEGYPEPFEAPMRADADIFRDVVHPFQNLSGSYTLELEPISIKHYDDPQALWRPAIILESYATKVSSVVFTSPESIHDIMCAYTMLAWHLVDDKASIMRFCEGFNFSLDVSIWAVVAVFRNWWALQAHLSEVAMNKYTNCLCQLIGILIFHDVVVHPSFEPTE
jgi:hypothetical protein